MPGPTKQANLQLRLPRITSIRPTYGPAEIPLYAEVTGIDTEKTDSEINLENKKQSSNVRIDYWLRFE